MTLTQIIEAIYGILTTLGIIGGGTAYQKSNKKHQESNKERVRLENRLSVLETKIESLDEIRQDIKEIKDFLMRKGQ